MIDLTCFCKETNVFYLIDLLCKGGWTVYNEKGNIEYLPIGDDELYNWQEDRISYEELRDIV